MGDGSLAASFEEIFDAHDEDHSGRLSFDEIVQVIETLMESRM